MKKLLIALLFIGFSFVSSNFILAQELRGSWELSPEGKDLRFSFTSRQEGKGGHMSTNETIAKSELKGYRNGEDVTFSLVRKAGEIKMTGDVLNDNGVGTFVFTPDQEYVKSMGREGMNDLSSGVLFLFALKNTDVEYVRSIKNLGYKDLSVENLTALVALNVSVDYVGKIHEAGFRDIAISKLIGFKAFNRARIYCQG
jgi:hypothetical protein